MTPALLAAIVLLVIGISTLVEDMIDERKHLKGFRQYSMVGPVLCFVSAVLVVIDLLVRFGP